MTTPIQQYQQAKKNRGASFEASIIDGCSMFTKWGDTYPLGLLDCHRHASSQASAMDRDAVQCSSFLAREASEKQHVLGRG